MFVNLSLDGVCTACHALIGVHPVLHNLGFPTSEGMFSYLHYPSFLFVLSPINSVLINIYKVWVSFLLGSIMSTCTRALQYQLALDTYEYLANRKLYFQKKTKILAELNWSKTMPVITNWILRNICHYRYRISDIFIGGGIQIYI